MNDEIISVLDKVKNQKKKDRKVHKINCKFFMLYVVMFVFNHFLKFNVPVQLLDMNIEEVVALEKESVNFLLEIQNAKIISGLSVEAWTKV